MNTLKREEVLKLSPEEQIALAQFEAEWVRTRQQLIGQAELSAPRDFLAGFLAAIATGLAILGFALPKVIPIAIIAVIVFVVVHVKGILHRLDAMMQLLMLGATPGAGRNPRGTQTGAAPNGGPAAALDKSGVTERPPSVS